MQTQLERFRQCGYVVIGALLEEKEVDELRSEYDRLFAEARKTATVRNLSSSDGAATTNADEEMLQITQMCERSLTYRQLLYNDHILDIAEDLIGPNIQLFHDQALFKPPYHGGPVQWHQDNGYWQCTPASLISCRMTLDDVDVNNGAMHVIPGSHLLTVPHEREDGAPLFDVADQIDPSQAEVIELPAGGVMFHHCQTLHHTPPNTTDRQRRAYAIHFMTPGTRSMRDGCCLEVGFSRPMLRMRI